MLIHAWSAFKQLVALSNSHYTTLKKIYIATLRAAVMFSVHQHEHLHLHSAVNPPFCPEAIPSSDMQNKKANIDE